MFQCLPALDSCCWHMLRRHGESMPDYQTSGFDATRLLWNTCMSVSRLVDQAQLKGKVSIGFNEPVRVLIAADSHVAELLETSRLTPAILARHGRKSEREGSPQRGCADYQHTSHERADANNLLSSGLERTDNGMKMTSWPEVTPINQKNYYTYGFRVVRWIPS